MCLVFATWLGFRFAPRIRDLADRRLYVPDKAKLLPESSDVYRRHHQVETDRTRDRSGNHDPQTCGWKARLLYRSPPGTTDAPSGSIARAPEGHMTRGGERFCETRRKLSWSGRGKIKGAKLSVYEVCAQSI